MTQLFLSVKVAYLAVSPTPLRLLRSLFTADQPCPTMSSYASPDEVLGFSSHSEVAGLPYDDEINFYESSFFQKHDLTSLPSPSVVREVASRSQDPRTKRRTRPPPVYLPSLGLCVKYGTGVSIHVIKNHHGKQGSEFLRSLATSLRDSLRVKA